LLPSELCKKPIPDEMSKLTANFLLAWITLCTPLLAQSIGLMSFEEAKQRADRGDAFAQAVVALHYQLGWNTEKNSELAAKYALASANAREPLGLFRLGALLRTGDGVPKDEQQGLAYQAASFNDLNSAQDPYSMTAAGIMIFQGRVVGQNVSEEQRRKDAAELYKKAADMGYAPAQFNYAMALNDGHGVTMDEQARDIRIQQSAALNYPLAVKWLQERQPAPTPLQSHSFTSGVSGDSGVPEATALDLHEKSFPLGIIDTVVQEVPESLQFVALERDGKVIATISDSLLHFYEAKTGRLLRKISFRDQTRKVGKRIYTGPTMGRFYLVLADENAASDEGEECFDLDYLTGDLRRVQLPRGSRVIGANPATGTIAVYSADGENALLTEIDADSANIERKVNLPPAWRDIVRAIYGPGGECGLVSLSGGEGVSLESVTIISPNGDVRTVASSSDIGRVSKQAFDFLAQLLNFDSSEVVIDRQDGIHTFADGYGIKSDKSVFGFVESMFLNTSSGLMLRSDGDLSYLIASSAPNQRKISTAGLAVDGIDCSADGNVLAAWSIAFKGSTTFRQDGKINSESSSRVIQRAPSEAFVYDAETTAYSCISARANQIWNAAISGDGRLVALATSQVESNSTPSSQFYSTGKRWPEVPSIDARAVLLDAWTGELKTSSSPSVIYPFVYNEAWFVAPEIAMEQTGMQFDRARYTADFARWLIESSKDSISLTTNAGSLTPRYEGWDIQSDNRRRTITDVTTGGEASWSTHVAWGDFDGNWRQKIESVLAFNGENGPQVNLREEVAIGAAYPLKGGQAVVVTSDAILKLNTDDGSKIAAFKIPDAGLLGREYRPTCQTFAISDDGSIAYVLAGNRSICRVDIKASAIELAATLYPVRNAPPVVVAEGGNYLAQAGSIDGIHFSDGQLTYPFEQFDLRLNRPDIVLERLGAPSEAVAIAKQMREKRLKRMGVTEDMLKPDFHVPELEIVGDVPATTDIGKINLAIKASDSKYPLERLKVYVNNVPVNGRDGESLRDQNTQTLERTLPIKLAAGRNKIQVSVLNNAGAESLYANAEVNCTVQRPKPTLYAVALGVSDYANPDWNLKYAAKDASDVLDRLKSRSGDNYAEVKELLLTDKEVTKESLAQIKDFLKDATIDDTVLMFVAGHGLLDSKYDYYFGTTDIDFNSPAEKGIAFDEFDDLLAGLPCLKKSLLIDTCHAGELDEDEKALLASAGGTAAPLPTGNGIAMRSIGTRGMNVKAIEGARGASEWYDRLQGLFVDLRRGSGATILSSSAGAEYALESSEQQNGLFTYAVLEALDGKKDADTNKDGSIQMSELGEYVKKRVSELTNNKQTPNTRRVNLEGDFTLAKTE